MVVPRKDASRKKTKVHFRGSKGQLSPVGRESFELGLNISSERSEAGHPQRGGSMAKRVLLGQEMMNCAGGHRGKGAPRPLQFPNTPCT